MQTCGGGDAGGTVNMFPGHKKTFVKLMNGESVEPAALAALQDALFDKSIKMGHDLRTGKPSPSRKNWSMSQTCSQATLNEILAHLYRAEVPEREG
jgi:hypothetical protein